MCFKYFKFIIILGSTHRSKKFHPLLYQDKLQQIGAICISIEHVGENVNICAASQFSYEEKGVRSCILSTVDKSMNLISEKHTQTLCSAHKKKVYHLNAFTEY